MSTIAGQAAVLKATEHLGILPVDMETMILGFGVVGRSAWHLLNNLGASVLAYDSNKEKRSYLNTFEGVENHLPEIDLLISSVYVPNNLAPKILTENHIKSMRRGSLFVDVSIDQGGSSETSIETTMEEPVYTEYGVKHMCVPNLPAYFPKSASLSLSRTVKRHVDSLIAHELDVTKIPALNNAIVRI